MAYGSVTTAKLSFACSHKHICFDADRVSAQIYMDSRTLTGHGGFEDQEGAGGRCYKGELKLPD